jgi:hypothetical protein
VKQCTGPTALVTSMNVLVMVQNCMRFWAIGPHGGSYEVLRSRSRSPYVQLSRPNTRKTSDRDVVRGSFSPRRKVGEKVTCEDAVGRLTRSNFRSKKVVRARP